MKLQEILRKIKKADKDYHMIEPHDRIAVGVSGGKDSMVLLTALHMYAKFPHRQFSVIGIHIDLGFPDMDFHDIDEFCNRNGITLYHEPTQVYTILQKNRDKNGRIPCSLCSKFKKATVIAAAQKYHCTKTAFAHHGDDAIETLLLNAVYGGRIATFKPKMFLTDTQMMFIRPLIYCYEEEIVAAKQINAIPEVKNTCPNDGFTKRQEMKLLLQALYQKYPEAKSNFLLMLRNQKQLDLWQPHSLKFDFARMNQEQAESIAAWHYAPPYSFYDAAANEEDLTELLNERHNRYYTAFVDQAIVGFFHYETKGTGMEINLGLHPDRCSHGWGCDFLHSIEAFLLDRFHPQFFQLSVAAFNQRAIKVYRRCGYTITASYRQAASGSRYEFYRMKKQVIASTEK